MSGTARQGGTPRIRTAGNPACKRFGLAKTLKSVEFTLTDLSEMRGPPGLAPWGHTRRFCGTELLSWGGAAMREKEFKTNVLRILDQKKIPYTAHFYDGEGPEGTREYGVHVAEALGQDPARGFKTLVAKGASKGVYVFAIPVAENLDLKKAAKAVGEKSVELLHVAEINAVTGYVRGGCSPIGMKKQYLTVFHKTALEFETVYVSAGKIGAQVEASPEALLALLGAGTADLIVS